MRRSIRLIALGLALAVGGSPTVDAQSRQKVTVFEA
jgi:hypothetical protein